MRNILLKTVTAAGAAALALAGTQASALTLMIEDLAGAGGTVIVSDEAGDANFDGDENGIVSFAGAIGGWVINITTGSSDPAFTGGPNSLGINLAGGEIQGSGQLRFTVADTLSFAVGGDYVLTSSSSVNFLPSNPATLDVLTQIDGVDILNDSMSNPGGFVNDSIVHTLADAQPFTLTNVATLTVGNSNTTTNFGVSTTAAAVPVPAALPLLASALVGFGLLGRRAKKRA